MTKRYNVHIYREMRLFFPNIDADTPETAAAIARDKLTDEADSVNDCNGDDFSALVDEVGDEQYERSVMIDFNAEQQHKIVPQLLDALRDLLGDLPSVQGGVCQHCGREYDDIASGDCPSDDCPSYKARAALARAKGGAR